MKRHETRPADLARGAGVSLDIIKKLRTRPAASTNAEAAAQIARFYGKSVAQFLKMDEDDDEQSLSALLDLLSEDEQKMLLRQIRGMLTQREE